MSGFSAQWLALREPADHRARNAVLRDAMVSHVQASVRACGEWISVADLGCGSGSNLRALAPFLPSHQRWSLVDYDPQLLIAARAALRLWADEILADDDMLRLQKSGKIIEVVFCQKDLAADIESVLAQPLNLVTAAAFFDLVAQDWIARFCKALSAPFYTVLTYDGVEIWQPPHDADAAILAAFHAHQATDKGFGLSAGPQATDSLEQNLKARGFKVSKAQSPWALGAPESELMRALANGSAGAVAETGLISLKDLEDWRAARQKAEACHIGHWDLLAIP